MRSKSKLFLLGMAGIMIFSSGCSNQEKSDQGANHENHKEAEKKVTSPEYSIIESKALKVDHLHGIGYPGNDSSLYLAAHDGLKIYKDSKWFETTANRNDYMGFQAIQEGFIASGHPQQGSVLKNPLGLIQSVDKGKTLKKLAFYGESDFHFLSASFSGTGIYVINEEPNSKLGKGVYFSADNGMTWKQSKLDQFKADSLGMIAVHPEKGETMAMATRSGIYYSVNGGDTMKALTGPIMATSLAFSGNDIYFSSVENKAILLRKLDPVTGSQSDVKIPFLDYDNPITYIAVDQKNPKRLAFATYKNDLYESVDAGNNWSTLLKNGQKQQD